MMDATSLALFALLCILPYIGVMVAIARLTSRSRLAFADRIRRGLQNGDYDAARHPKRARQLRLFVLVASLAALLTVGLIIVSASYYMFPALYTRGIGPNGMRNIFVVALVVLSSLAIVLNAVFQRIMRGGDK